MVVPVPVRFDDLADPTFPPEAEPIREAMAEMGAAADLDPEALLDLARASTGLDDFGTGGWRDALDVLCHALRTEAGLSAAGRFALHTQLVGFLRSRLLVADLLTRHPEIHDLPVEAPIVICGQPRTGTTHLQNLLAADPALRHLPYWESVEPVLAETEQPGPGEQDPRLARTELALDVVNTALPYFKRMHEMTVDHAHEEIQLLALEFSTMLFETLVPMPTYRDWYRSTDQRSAYAYLRTVLQVLQWLRGGTRWVLKSPQHLEQLPVLSAVFPDATVVVTHRDPVPVIGSAATMLAYVARLHLEAVDPQAIGRYWAQRIEAMMTACAADRDVWPPEQSMDLRFADFMADDRGSVARIYELAGQPFDDRARAAMDSYLAGHVRDRHGKVVHDFGALGLDPALIRSSLAFYTERFAIQEER